jgi:hypothetical protein
MSVICSRESAVLSPAEEVLSAAVSSTNPDLRDEVRLRILEAAAARVGGYSYGWYESLREDSSNQRIGKSPIEVFALKLVDILKALPIHTSLALASLASPPLTKSEKRRGGAYYTDWRLAQFLAAQLKVTERKQPLIIDPASGTGILLVATALAMGKNQRRRADRLIADSLFAADLSSRALRGAALALSSLTGDRAVITSLLRHLRCGDSLRDGAMMWKDAAPDGFDVVLGNPPWEKLKLSRHEFLVANGVDRHYGAGYDAISRRGFDREQRVMKRYVEDFRSDFYLQGSGETDFYKLFVELALRLVRADGSVALYVPAGLIRSLGTKRLRQFISDKCSDVSLTVLENRARFFAIDTRFKFMLLSMTVKISGTKHPFVLRHAMGNETAVKVVGAVAIDREALGKIRPDMSVPEVRTEAEWKLFRRICAEHTSLGNQTGHWVPSLMREIDMTRDRGNFLQTRREGAVPVIEGRMIHQYRHAVKVYISGTGRSATWEAIPEGRSCVFKPQFWYALEDLPASVRKRVEKSRVGFCDITGQTNERAMLAARIPAGVVCGNKVPTIVFPHARQHEFLVESCWLGIANSLLFDWLLRRIVTTTVNYFLLLGLPFPVLDWLSPEVKRLAELVNAISSCCHESEFVRSKRPSPWQIAEFRAEIECRVLDAYGLGVKELRLVLEDFPLLDRAQPPLAGERRSTITKDFVLWTVSKSRGGASAREMVVWASRIERAKASGAVPFVPSHLGGDIQPENCFETWNEEGTHAPHDEEAGPSVLSRSVAG